MQAPSTAPGKRPRAGVALNRPAARCVTLVAAVVVCLEHSICPSAASTSPPITSITPINSHPSHTSQQTDGPFGVDAIANFLQKRCVSTDIDERPALWSYEGSLTDPTTGRVVAEVEGLELVKALPTLEASDLPNDDGIAILGGLLAKDLLCPKPTKAASSPQWDAATTVLSRRLFCYRRPQSRTNEDAASNSNENPYNSLLTSLRLRPDGPLRHLSPLENMAVYDSAITYLSRNGGREMAVLSEQGGRDDGTIDGKDNNGGRSKQYVMGSAQTESSSDGQSSSELDFAILAQRGTCGRSDEPKLPPLKLPSSTGDGSEEVVISPPRSRLLQSGKGDGSGGASERKYGSVRETYRYTFDHNDAGSNKRGKLLGFYVSIMQKLGRKQPGEGAASQSPKCAVRYTRYGEAPPWYAPGRSCTLELRGKRIALTPNANDGGSTHSNLTDRLPPLASWAASKCNFWSGWPTAFSSISRRSENEGNEASMQLAVDSFCNERQPSFGHLEDYPVAKRKKWLVSTEMALSKMQTCASRISKSFDVRELPR